MAAQNRLRQKTLEHTLPYILIIGGAIGLLASLVLTYDKIQVLLNPGYNPACNINPILSCGSVMQTEQAMLFGMPNTVFGVAAFSALVMFGLMLSAGIGVKRWLWLAAQAAATVGVIFMHYLFFQGVYRIHAVCPWCFVVWMVTIPIFWYITLYNLRQRHIRIPPTVNTFLQQNHGNILVAWYFVIFAIILEHFWYYWQTFV